ncbi:Unknown protein sequence [Pseudomonas amygdali pv. sesami]|nr:Unknown protein sequence [Pseudomonas amygdali pv. sesami]RMV87187.1 hypothetical protein ALP04_03451 [Pseudomonas amygdali pv. sesami]
MQRLLNIIGALVETILGSTTSGRRHSVFDRTAATSVNSSVALPQSPVKMFFGDPERLWASSGGLFS